MKMILDILVSIKNALSYFFILNYKIGQFIVSTLCVTIQALSEFGGKILFLLKIVSEDFHSFIQDIYRNFVSIWNWLASSIDETCIACMWAVDKITLIFTSGISITWDETYNFFINSLNLAHGLLISLHNFVKLCGAGLRFLLSIFPMTLYYCFNICRNINLTLSFTQIHQTIFEIFNSHTSVITSRFKNSISSLVVFISLGFYVLLISLFVWKCSQVIIRISRYIVSYILPKLRMKTRSIKRFFQKVENNEKKESYHFCIICDERIRCIVILPCRHLCLCRECNIVLRRYQSNCPVCRQEIEETMKVFL